MEEWRLKSALSSGRKQWTNRLYKQAGAQKKLPCFTGFNLWLRELVMLLGGAGVAISTFLNSGPDHFPQFSTMTFYQRFCSWGWGVGANLVHCHSKAIQVPITLTKLRSIGYRQAYMNLRGEEVFPCKSADLLSFPGCGLVDCMFTAHSDEQPVLCNHNVPFTGQPTIFRNNLCRKFYIFSPATPSCKTQRTS